MYALGGKVEVRHGLYTVRHCHKDSVVLGGLGIGAEISRIIKQGNRVTFEDNGIDGVVRRVLAIVGHLGFEFAIDPLSVIEPLDRLRLVVYLASELERRNTGDELVVSQRVGEGIAVLNGRLAIHGSSSQLGVVNKMEVFQ